MRTLALAAALLASIVVAKPVVLTKGLIVDGSGAMTLEIMGEGNSMGPLNLHMKRLARIGAASDGVFQSARVDRAPDELAKALNAHVDIDHLLAIARTEP